MRVYPTQENTHLHIVKSKVKWFRYRPGVAQRVGRCIALLFHARGTRRGWVVSSTPRPHFTPGKDPIPILQEAGWIPGPVWTGGNSRPHRNSISDRPVRSQSLYWLIYTQLHIKKSYTYIYYRRYHTNAYRQPKLSTIYFILFLISNFRRVLNVVYFLLGNSPASEFYVPTFRNILYQNILYTYPPMKMEQSLMYIGPCIIVIVEE